MARITKTQPHWFRGNLVKSASICMKGLPDEPRRSLGFFDHVSYCAMRLQALCLFIWASLGRKDGPAIRLVAVIFGAWSAWYLNDWSLDRGGEIMVGRSVVLFFYCIQKGVAAACSRNSTLCVQAHSRGHRIIWVSILREGCNVLWRWNRVGHKSPSQIARTNP